MKRLLSLTLAIILVFALTACSTQEEETTNEDNVLRVAMECGYAPYNWTQPDDSNGAVPIANSSDFAYGYDVMWAQELAETLGKELEIVKLDWESLIPALTSGDVDAVIAGQSITAERLEVVDFSNPYYFASIVSLVNQDSEYAQAMSIKDFAGATATSQIGTVWYDVCLPQIDDIDLLPAQESAPSMLVALDSGAIDLVVTDMPTAMAAVITYPDMMILDFSNTDGDFEVSQEEINIGISVKKGNTEVLEAANAMLSGKTAEDFAQMMQEAISVQPVA